MKIWHSATSSYSRKANIAIKHHNLENVIKLQTVESATEGDNYYEENPFGKLPALKLDNGQWLFGNRLVTKYIESLGRGTSLEPVGADKWERLNMEVICSSFYDNTAPYVTERISIDSSRSWDDRYAKFIERNTRILKYIEENIENFSDRLDFASISLVILVDFIVARELTLDLNLEELTPKLLNWAKMMNAKYPILAESKLYAV